MTARLRTAADTREVRTARNAHAGEEDAGFGLVEVLVSMAIFTIVMLAIVPVQIRSMKQVAFSRERQTATGFATSALENVRAAAALPGRATAIALGRSDVTGDPNVAGCSGLAPTCSLRPALDATFAARVAGETLKHAGSDPALVTQRCSTTSGCTTVPTATLSGLVYTTRLYVSATSTSSLVNLTVITTWTSRNAPVVASTQQVAVRSQLVTS